MAKIMFVGDVHLLDRTPSSRKDNYSQTMLDKIAELVKMQNELQIDDVVFLGDVFHQRYQTYAYMMRCYKAFSEFKKPPYTIVGNHDIVFERIETLEESPLNFLFMTGVLKHLDKLEYDDVVVKGFDYTSPITPNEDLNKYVVCVAHQYYNTPLYKSYIKPEEALSLGYQAYVLGHDHSVYDDIVNAKYKVIRAGSLSRGTAHSANLIRDVYVTIFDTTTKEFTRVKVPTQKATDVFKEIKYVEKSLEKSVDDIIDKMEFNVDKTIYDIMDEYEGLPPEVKSLIVRYLEDNGIFRNKVSNTNTLTGGETIDTSNETMSSGGSNGYE